MQLSFVTSQNLLQLSLCKTSKKHLRFSVVFSRKTVKIKIIEAKYLKNGLADFKDFGLILQQFERFFR